MSNAAKKLLKASVKYYDCLLEFADEQAAGHGGQCEELEIAWEDAVEAYKDSLERSTIEEREVTQ